MSNYPEGGAPYEGAPGSPGSGATSTGASAYPEPTQAGYQGVDMSHGGAAPHYQTQQFPPTNQPQWQGQPSYANTHGSNQSQKKDAFSNRLKEIPSELLVFALTSLALLIAAAVTDRGDDNQGFGAQDAWKYVTALAIAYIISRGLTKFSRYRRDDHDHDHH